MGAWGVALVYGRVLRIAKSGGGGREDETLHTRRAHCVQQMQGVGDVVGIVLGRLLDRFAHLDKRRKVHHRVKTPRLQ